MNIDNAIQAQVISAFGKNFKVKVPVDGYEKVYHCYVKGKRAGICVGDMVELEFPEGADSGEALIKYVLNRKNLLYRSDDMRIKLFASNVDLLAIVVGVEPEFSQDLLGRAIVAATSEGIEPLIILNKVDLESADIARAKLAIYKELNLSIVETSKKHPTKVISTLKPYFEGKTSILLGQSGMGKSSLLNILVKDANASTQEFSVALGSGKHTTTTTHMYDISDFNGRIIDSPGFQTFGLKHLTQNELTEGFPEFMPYVGKCKFYNCQHLTEPSCAITEALRENKISQDRYDLYTRILAECNSPERY
ncbi:ribosome small subunit-dependent GTPase A [Taylorella equigenitalis]|uniref:ribosome small subunit-dependent GTPase A n=1 Tax=Taylorella equigenitalis TaxID=29575 RepID=UPI0004182358|nr:ribosome small subunit-dependent GTPase A [Taylorella equigenitalis]ASY37908.1 ribosome small subunit-dependent GTPase A [Taylorella equigenitalis]ASY42329.1 ribosome small subunit-dependent GTPase [Taylorella equigenitalis]KGK32927.1 GTPase RsgA [Taylorella equigenitalis]RBA26029.1 ribosome small subunit-dependent GTPase A [Taylorella equigenitalis]